MRGVAAAAGQQASDWEMLGDTMTERDEQQRGQGERAGQAHRREGAPPIGRAELPPRRAPRVVRYSQPPFRWECRCQEPPVLLATYTPNGRINIKVRDRYWHLYGFGQIHAICPRCGAEHVLDLQGVAHIDDPCGGCHHE